MRVPVICLAVVVTVFLALPETTGAPAFPGSESYKREEQNLKKVAKEGQEGEQYYEATSNANGMVSGVQMHSQDKSDSELEEQQSRSSEEIRTASGGIKKTEKEKKQKKVVTNSEHKSVLVYYMVSYKSMPKQKSGEDRVVYYQRIFPVEDNLKQFYHKIFKNYDNEKSVDYIERVEFILNNVYADYDPRLDVKWLEEFDHYYTLKYSRKSDECDESYFPRVLAKESDESCEHYKKRMECLVAALDEEDFTHITFDDSELGYVIGVRTSPARSTSAPDDDDDDDDDEDDDEDGVESEVNTSSKKLKAEEVSVDESELEIKNAGGSTAHEKKVKKKRTTVEKEVKSKTSTFRMAYNKLPTKPDGQSLTDYYKNFFGEYTLSSLSEETKSELYLRLLIQYREESVEEYITRVDYLFNEVYPEFDIRTDEAFANLLTHYYKSKYAILSGETEADWCTRVLKKQEGETVEHYKQRVICLQTAIKDIEWDDITIDENSADGYTLVSRGSSSQASTKSLTEEEIQKTYFKTDSEDVTTYVNRIAKELSSIQTNDDYITIVTTVFNQYPELPLWYDLKYYELFKDYYTTIYQKTSVETEEDYFKRLVTQQSYETEELYVQRIEVLQKLFPTLPLWSDESYYEKYFKTYYSTVYCRLSNEDDATYFARILSKCEKESNFAFITRLNLIRMTYPDLDLWYDLKYSSLISKYYQSVYVKKNLETEEAYYTRLLTKNTFETDELYYKRLHLLEGLFPTLSVWSDDLYFEKYIKSYNEYVYRRLANEDDATYFSRIVSKFNNENDIVYVTRLSLIKRTYPDLDIWYDSKYIDLVNTYYSTLYAKKEAESVEEYYQRFLTKESCESNEIYVKRIQVLQKLYPTLSIWYDANYYQYVKECYDILYQQIDTEDELTYFTRVVSNLEGESDETYVTRMALIQQTYSVLPLWYCDSYYDLVKRYYSLKYAQLSGESDEVYVQRLVAREEGDTTDIIYGRRIHLIHLATVSSSVWYDEAYYQSFTKSYYQSYYSKFDEEACADWLKRVITILPGECESNAIKRITLIKNCTNYNCWTEDILCEIETCFAEAYIITIRETFFSSASSYSTSSTSSSTEASSEESESEFVAVSRG